MYMGQEDFVYIQQLKYCELCFSNTVYCPDSRKGALDDISNPYLHNQE